MMTTAPATSAPSPATAAPPSGRRSSARWVLTAIAVLSILLGLLAFHRYRQSEAFLRAAVADFRQRGQALDAEACVREALAWAPHCSAMLSLCDASVSRMTLACLEGRPRGDYCTSAGRKLGDAREVFRRCKQFHVKGRRSKRACVGAYGMVYAYCLHVNGEEP